ncbi:DNA alkylation repair protein [Bacteroidota bacterium]
MFFTEDSVNNMANKISEYYAGFDKKKFVNLVFARGWLDKELKERMRHVTQCLHKTLPDNYGEALEILKKVIPHIKGFDLMCMPDYVEVYGLDDWEQSLPALSYFTLYASSEFAIRPFLDKNPEKGMKYMLELAGNENHSIRRFSSEGCRPRLPWAMALPKFKNNPSLIIPVLEKLKNDESDFVRRSVANNLNDISKDNPELALELCGKWKGKSDNTDWIIKHACRGMLKAGNKRALMLFGFGDPQNIDIEDLNFIKEEANLGEKLQFSFKLINRENELTKIRLEYCVYYMKANGKLAGKVFQISEKSYKTGKYSFKRNQAFVNMTTRKHYPGKHEISIIVNGEEKIRKEFELKM